MVWTIEANGFYGIPADAISTPEHYYFTLPTFAQQGYGDDLEKAADVSRHPVLGRFPAFFMRNSATGNRKYVLLSRDHRLPFVTITKGQYLDAVEVAIGRWRSAEKRRITEAEQGDQKRIAIAMKYVDERTAKRTAVLATNREKYTDRLQETAEIATDEPDVMLENYPDVFERNGGTAMRLPVYTIDPRLAELCKTDAPQWIVMSWTAQLNATREPEPARRHPQQRRRRVHLQLLLRSRQGEGATVQAPPIPVVHRGGRRRRAVRGGQEERGGSRGAFLRRLFVDGRGQEAAQLAKHPG